MKNRVKMQYRKFTESNEPTKDLSSRRRNREQRAKGIGKKWSDHPQNSPPPQNIVIKLIDLGQLYLN